MDGQKDDDDTTRFFRRILLPLKGYVAFLLDVPLERVRDIIFYNVKLVVRCAKMNEHGCALAALVQTICMLGSSIAHHTLLVDVLLCHSGLKLYLSSYDIATLRLLHRCVVAF